MRKRRAFVLIAVMVLVGCAVFVVTGIVFLVRGEVAGAANAVDATKLRLASWSGVQAVAARLAAQRTEILRGGTPTVEPSFILWEADDESASCQLLPVGPDGALIVAENGRIDVRTATSSSLQATSLISADVAAAIIAASGGAATPPESLLGAGDGLISIEALYGPLEDISLGIDDDAAIRSGEALERLLAGSSAPRGLCDLLTTFADEPPLRVDGSPRLSVQGEWTDDRRGAIDVLLGSGSAAVLEAVTKEVEYPTFGNLFAAWRAKHPEPRDWRVFLDAIAADERPVEIGRLDVMRASTAALLTLPGMNEERAGLLQRQREALADADRESPAWLVEQGILSADEFAAIVDRVTIRSLLWRVRIRTVLGSERDGDPRDLAGRAAVFEAVIDLSGETPRLAWLRDITSLETAAQLIAATIGVAPPERDERAEPDPGADPEDAPADREEPVAVVAPDPPDDEVDASAGKERARVFPRGAGRWRRSQDVGE